MVQKRVGDRAGDSHYMLAQLYANTALVARGDAAATFNERALAHLERAEANYDLIRRMYSARSALESRRGKQNFVRESARIYDLALQIEGDLPLVSHLVSCRSGVASESRGRGAPHLGIDAPHFAPHLVATDGTLRRRPVTLTDGYCSITKRAETTSPTHFRFPKLDVAGSNPVSRSVLTKVNTYG
jgi:hypothetical protein